MLSQILLLNPMIEKLQQIHYLSWQLLSWVMKWATHQGTSLSKLWLLPTLCLLLPPCPPLWMTTNWLLPSSNSLPLPNYVLHAPCLPACTSTGALHKVSQLRLPAPPSPWPSLSLSLRSSRSTQFGLISKGGTFASVFSFKFFLPVAFHFQFSKLL